MVRPLLPPLLPAATCCPAPGAARGRPCPPAHAVTGCCCSCRFTGAQGHVWCEGPGAYGRRPGQRGAGVVSGPRPGPLAAGARHAQLAGLLGPRLLRCEPPLGWKLEWRLLGCWACLLACLEPRCRADAPPLTRSCTRPPMPRWQSPTRSCGATCGASTAPAPSLTPPKTTSTSRWPPPQPTTQTCDAGVGGGCQPGGAAGRTWWAASRGERGIPACCCSTLTPCCRCTHTRAQSALASLASQCGGEIQVSELTAAFKKGFGATPWLTCNPECVARLERLLRAVLPGCLTGCRASGLALAALPQLPPLTLRTHTPLAPLQLPHPAADRGCVPD